MGIWDIGFFDNDIACDWENQLKHRKELNYIETEFRELLTNTEDVIDIELASKSLAAAEALARLVLKDGESTTYTKHLDSWVQDGQLGIKADLVTMAIKSVTKNIELDSELKQLLTLRGDYLPWCKEVENLLKRLNNCLEILQ